MTAAAVLSALALSTPIAAERWRDLPDPPCGEPTVQVLRGDELTRMRGNTDHDVKVADADPETCVIRVAWDRVPSRTFVCALVIHEYGHLVGLGHVNNPAASMYKSITRAPVRCLRAFAPQRVARLKARRYGCAPSGVEWGWLCLRGARASAWVDAG